jgi:cytoskeleton protein RodZ
MVLIVSAAYERFRTMNEKMDIPAEAKTPELPRENLSNLKTAREARGLSLSDVFDATRVSRINLEALENDDFARLPPPVYTRNFIRKYAQAVGVDEKPILDRYEKHRLGLTPSREESAVQKPWPEDSRRYRFLFGTLAAVIVAGVLVYAIFLYDQSGNSVSPAKTGESTPQAKIVPAPSVEKPSTVQTDALPESLSAAPSTPAMTKTVPAPTVSAALPPVATLSGKTLHLVIETVELTWVRITEDRNPSLQLLLKPGDRIERMASDSFLLDIGNAGGINLIFQGKPLETLGKRGQVIHVRLPEKTQEKRSP